ncbi:MAG: phosphoprotein phosphatase, partial [Deltaproteobacteria bacterium]|nr:phosphoprotein phosphatase [Deltaproteobacteria bacterium]
TTLSGLLVINNRGFIAHVGDSRIYLLRGGRVVQLTEDHSLINELIKRGKLAAADADKSPYKNAVTRAVGVYESVEVDTLDFEVLPGDQFLLASDGLTGYLKDEHIPPRMAESDPIEEVPKAFIDFANDAGGKDNITTIVVRMFDPEGKAAELHKEVNFKIDTIRRMPIFKYLTYKELVRILNITKVLELGENQRVITEGDDGEDLFIVLRGGEMALIDKAPRSASVTATVDARVMQISRPDFFNIIRNEPRMATKLLWSFLQVLSERLRMTSAELSGAMEDDLEDLTEELFEIEPMEDDE